jgi:phosphatidylinositol alpha-1,6-mannosyltransferase
MAGLPTIQAQLEKLAAELGVAGHIHVLGRVDQPTLLAAYNACDLFLMTSRHSSDGDSEGYGIAVIEAALCGKAAVVSGESGLAEAVVDGQTGLLVTEDNPEETARAVLRLLQDEALRHKMAKQAHKRALEESTWSKRVDAYERILTELLAF